MVRLPRGLCAPEVPTILFFDNLGVFLVKFDETVLVVRVKLFARTMEQVQLKFFSWLDIRTFAFGQVSSVSNNN